MNDRAREGLQILAPFLAEEVWTAMTPQLIGRLLATLGPACELLGEMERAIGIYEQALVILREVGDRNGEASALCNLGIVYRRLGESERAIRLYEEALVINSKIGNRLGESSVVGNLGLAYADLGELKKAIEFYEHQLEIVSEIDDREGEATALSNLGVAYVCLKDWKRDLGIMSTRGRSGVRSVAAVASVRSWSIWGTSTANKINYETQSSYMIRRWRSHARLMIVGREGSVLGNLGRAYADLGENEKAIALLEQALDIGRAIMDPQIIRIATDQLARLRGGGGGEEA